MSYLYEDSTPSPLTINFIDFLREALDMAVKILMVDRRLRDLQQQGREYERATQVEAERLDLLVRGLNEVLELADAAPPNSPTARCAAALRQTAQQTTQGELTQARTTLSTDQARLAEQSDIERQRTLRALESLLQRHDLPETVHTLSLRWTEGQRYVVRLTGQTSWGISSVMDLQVPPGNFFAQLVRVERLNNQLEVQAPARAGFLRKGVRLQSHWLVRHHLTELLVGVTQTRFKLRLNSDGSGPGFEVAIPAMESRVQLVTLDSEGEPSLDPYNASAADAAKLVELCDLVIGPAFELARARGALLEATFDDQPLQSVERVAQVVERLVEVMTPVVQEILRHSLSPHELVLKRLVSGDRREEVFVTRVELLEKLSQLTEDERACFQPLGLDTPRTVVHVATMPERRVPAPPVAETAAESVIELEKRVRRGTGFHRIGHLPASAETTPVPTRISDSSLHVSVSLGDDDGDRLHELDEETLERPTRQRGPR